MDPNDLLERILDVSEPGLFIRTANFGKQWRTDIFYAEVRNQEYFSLYHVRYWRHDLFGKFIDSPIKRKALQNVSGKAVADYLAEILQGDIGLSNWTNFWDSLRTHCYYAWYNKESVKQIEAFGLNSIVNLSQCHALLQNDCMELSQTTWNTILHRLEHEIEGLQKQFGDSLLENVKALLGGNV
jgi:hypothetical protein